MGFSYLILSYIAAVFFCNWNSQSQICLEYSFAITAYVAKMRILYFQPAGAETQIS